MVLKALGWWMASSDRDFLLSLIPLLFKRCMNFEYEIGDWCCLRLALILWIQSLLICLFLSFLPLYEYSPAWRTASWATLKRRLLVIRYPLVSLRTFLWAFLLVTPVFTLGMVFLVM